MSSRKLEHISNILKIGESNNNHLFEYINVSNFENKRCFIIGGGTSLKEFDFSILRNDITIGINRSFEYTDSTFLYIMDKAYYDNVVDNKFGHNAYLKFKNFSGHIVMPTPWDGLKLNHNIKIIRRSTISQVHIQPSDAIYTGNNSGFGALMLAILLGCNPIYLLGYDLYREGNNTNYHSGYYNNAQFFRDYSDKMNQYKKMFILFHKDIKNLGIQVYNLNRSSNLKCFDFADIEDLDWI